MRRAMLLICSEMTPRVHLQHALSLAGYDVLAVASGDLAVHRLYDLYFDLILLDAGLPGGGMALLRRLRAIQPDMPVVLMADEAERERIGPEAMALGVVDILPQPPAADEAVALVGRVLQRQALSTAPAADSPERLLEQARLLLTQRAFGPARALLLKAREMAPADRTAPELLGTLSRMQEQTAAF